MILPKTVLQDAGIEIGTALDVSVVAGAIVARPARHPRDGWEEAAAALVAAGDDGLVWPEFANEADDEWTWPGLGEEATPAEC